jgi:hypothetical protein
LVTVKVCAWLDAPSAMEPKGCALGEMLRAATPLLPEDEELEDELLEEELEDELLEEEEDDEELLLVVPPSGVLEPEQPVAKARAREAKRAVFRNRFELKREDVVVIVFFSTGFSPLKQLFSSTGFPPSKSGNRARA